MPRCQALLKQFKHHDDIEKLLIKNGHPKPEATNYGHHEMRRYYKDLETWRAKADYILVEELNGGFKRNNIVVNGIHRSDVMDRSIPFAKD